MPSSSKSPKIAIVHEWLVTYAGSERVIEQLLKVYPDADLFCLVDVMPETERKFLNGKKAATSFLQKFPFKKKLYRHYLPFFPIAVEQFNLSTYDIVISNCHAVSKGVITSPEQLHISYIHTPIRYAWDMQDEYFDPEKKFNPTNFIARMVLHYIRIWDIAASNRPDIILGNSGFIKNRIKKIYRKEARIFYPPVDTDYFSFQQSKSDFYLAASRLVPYKKIEVIAQAFAQMPDKKLVIIGDGPEREKIRAVNSPNIRWLGYQEAEALRKHMQDARAFIFAAKEDFGITPLEAQACGTPVLAYREGGASETVLGLDASAPTGVFFDEQTPQAICHAVQEFERHEQRITPAACRQNAERFSNERFRKEIVEIVETAWQNFRK